MQKIDGLAALIDKKIWQESNKYDYAWNETKMITHKDENNFS